MNIIYNNFDFCSTNFDDFFIKVDNSLTKNQRNFLSDLFVSILSSTSCNFDKIAIDLSHKYSDIKLDSILKRISRFFNNPRNNFHFLFDNLIYYIFSNFKVKHDDNRVFISFDHMFVKDKFTIFMLSLKIGKQGFPIFLKPLMVNQVIITVKLLNSKILNLHFYMFTILSNLFILILILSLLPIVGLVIFFLFLILLIILFTIPLFLDVKITSKFFINLKTKTTKFGCPFMIYRL